MKTRYHVVPTRSVPEEGDALYDEYDHRHLADRLWLPDVISVRRFRPAR